MYTLYMTERLELKPYTESIFLQLRGRLLRDFNNPIRRASYSQHKPILYKYSTRYSQFSCIPPTEQHRQSLRGLLQSLDDVELALDRAV